MSSLASFQPMPVRLDYHASKVAVRYFAEGLRALIKADNVGCTAICPGFVRVCGHMHNAAFVFIV